MVEVELFHKGYKERTEIDMTEEQKQNIILKMPQLAYYNPEINWKTRKIKMMRYLDECRKQWKTKQMKPEQQKQKEKEQKKEKNKKFKKPTVEEEMEIARIIEEKQEEEEDLIKIRTVEEMVPRRFYKYLKVFEKKKSERMIIWKT